MAAAFQFTLFGPPQLRIAQSVADLPPQPAALCAYLILNRQRRVTREEVQAAFWPDAAPPRAQERLRRALYLLRRAVEPHADLIAAEGSELAIAPEVDLWVDYDAFEQALMAAYRTDPPGRRALEAAAALYTDDLLKDVYSDWITLEREHARQRFLTALHHLLGLCQQDADWQAAIRYAHLLLAHDPYQEAAYRMLMLAYAAMGDRSAALRQYQQCAQMLREDIGAEPMPETTRLFEEIRQGNLPAIMPPARRAPAPAGLPAFSLVGREQELSEIAAEWRTCQGGASRLVLVTGSAGMGKTRLVEEAVARLPGPAVTVLTGNCYAMEAGTPYQLIADLLRKADDRLTPDLRSALAPLLPDGQATGVSSLPLQEAVAQAIRALAGGGLWLVAEDLHWADPASLACLNYALRRCADLPVLALATLRDEELAFDSPLMDWPTYALHAPAPTTLIRLLPLPREQLEHLVAQLTRSDAAPLVALLERETAGNPLFVVETLRTLAEQGTLYAGHEGEWRLRAANGAAQSFELPVSDVVLRVIQGRIRRLSRAAQEVLVAAAVLEHDIDEKLLAQLVDPALAFDLALDEILRLLILHEVAPGVYQFAHIKVREVIYADTSAPRRRYLHRRIAERLAAEAAGDGLARTAQLAYHYAQAREWTPALMHGWQAAQIAWTTGALAEANRYAGIAGHILEEHNAELDHAALPESLPAIRFDLLALQAEFRRRAATAGLHYPPDLLDALDALLPDVDDSRRARAALQQAIHALGVGDLAGARESAQRGRRLYARLEDRVGEMDALQHEIEIAYHAGDMVALRHLLGALRSLVAPGARTDPGRTLTYNEMRLAVYEQRWTDVLALARQLAVQVSDPVAGWRAWANLGTAYLKLGAYDEAYDAARRAVAASEDAGVLGLGARVLLARLDLRRGELGRARDRLVGLLETPDPLVGESEIVAPALVLVRCAVHDGSSEDARRWARRAAQAVSRIRLPVLYPLSQVAWALAHLAAGKYPDAEKRLRYPLEFMLLVEDTSPQEICALRAAAARGVGDTASERRWLAQAAQEIERQGAGIADPVLRGTFLEGVPLHRLVRRALAGARWTPRDLWDPRPTD